MTGLVAAAGVTQAGAAAHVLATSGYGAVVGISLGIGIPAVVLGAIAVIVASYYRLQRHRADAVAMAREKFVNYDEEMPYLVARLRANYAGHVGDPDWEEDIRRLAELSPEFTERWARHEVAEPEVRTRIFVPPEAGRLAFSVTELEVTSTPGTRILAYTPQDDGTRARLPLIRPRAAGQDGEKSSPIPNGTW